MNDWRPITWPEFVASQANWFDRLRCRWFGHVKTREWNTHDYCQRCGVDLRSVVLLFRAVAHGEMTAEKATDVLMRRRR